MKLSELSILIRGAGEMASALGWRLHMSRFKIVMTEQENPLAVRRRVSFCEAVYDGTAMVEGVTGRRANALNDIPTIQRAGEIPILVDPAIICLKDLKPDVMVDATLSKRNMGIRKNLAPLVIAMGPGFTAGTDTHMVIETNRGHNLGRIITQGPAEPNTGVPGTIGGQNATRVLRAPAEGEMITHVDLGSMVTVGQPIASVNGVPIKAGIDGLLRGLIRPGSHVTKGLKIGDVDPRGDTSYLDTISDKARAVAGAVLEGILRVYNR